MAAANNLAPRVDRSSGRSTCSHALQNLLDIACELRFVRRMTNKPAHSIRLSPVKATIWANQREPHESGDGRPFYTVTFSRTYKDAEGKWQDSTNFSRDDLLLLAKLADESHSWIYSQQSPKEA